MQTFLSVVAFITTNYQAIISGVAATLAGLTALFMVIPGEQPEKTFRAIATFLSKFSAKKSD